MPQPVIQVENLSKQYRLGEVGTGTLSHDLKRWWYRARGREDPYARIGELNDRSTRGSSEYVWALKDINFSVQPGEVLGIIGRNGAGKSTLLKLLSKTTAPTTGNIKVRGRIASLLEVGTGFHPELTGRENIYLNGAILGMTRREITRQFDAIVDFAGVERYVDTPVKRYSSGMYVRLAFAVAAHLEPEILIVDEVLAVGDAEFQKKCLGKMKDVSVNDGRTVLFVSHNMGAIQSLCDQCALMHNGSLLKIDQTRQIISLYLKNENDNDRVYYYADANKASKDVFIQNIKFNNNLLLSNEIIILNIEVCSLINQSISIDIRLKDMTGVPVGFGSLGAFEPKNMVSIKNGINKFKISLSTKNLAVGNYFISVDLTIPDITYFDRLEDVFMFDIMKFFSERRYLEQAWNYGAYKLDIINEII